MNWWSPLVVKKAWVILTIFLREKQDTSLLSGANSFRYLFGRDA